LIANYRVALVIPARDEERLLPRVLADIPSWVWKVILVDDGSRDGTWGCMMEWNDDRAEILTLRPGRGVGGAILAGYRRALELRADASVVVAADAQMDLGEVTDVIEPLVHGEAEYVQGTRFPGGKIRGAMPRLRQLGNRWLSASASWAARERVSDSQCGFTAATHDFLRRLSFDDIPEGYGFPAFVRIEAHRMGARVAEVPVRAIYGEEVSGIRPLSDPPRICLRVLWRGLRHRTERWSRRGLPEAKVLSRARIGQTG
jgi:glycosyltransferase involved in cell wall biosynthesis